MQKNYTEIIEFLNIKLCNDEVDLHNNTNASNIIWLKMNIYIYIYICLSKSTHRGFFHQVTSTVIKKKMI